MICGMKIKTGFEQRFSSFWPKLWTETFSQGNGKVFLGYRLKHAALTGIIFFTPSHLRLDLNSKLSAN